MDIQAKLQILSGAARYDASCASSGSKREASSSGIGNTSQIDFRLAFQYRFDLAGSSPVRGSASTGSR